MRTRPSASPSALHPWPLQVLDTQDLLDATEDSLWAVGHGCRQAGGILDTSASLLDTSSTCLDTSCLDDLMDTVLEDGPSGGPLAAGAPRGEAASALVGLASLVVQLSAGILVHTI